MTADEDDGVIRRGDRVISEARPPLGSEGTAAGGRPAPLPDTLIGQEIEGKQITSRDMSRRVKKSDGVSGPLDRVTNGQATIRWDRDKDGKLIPEASRTSETVSLSDLTWDEVNYDEKDAERAA